VLPGGGCRWQAVGVPTRLVNLIVDAVEPARLARFWAAALGWEIGGAEGGVVWPHEYRYPDPVAPFPDHDQAAAVAALLAAGAVPADIGQGSVSWTVLADPEGSEFCVLSPL
jgi:hypothetical protein